MLVDNLEFHAHLVRGHVPNMKLLSCNFCDEYPLDMILYREIFNTVLEPATTVLDIFFNPILMKKKIPWPGEIMNVA